MAVLGTFFGTLFGFGTCSIITAGKSPTGALLSMKDGLNFGLVNAEAILQPTTALKEMWLQPCID